MGSFLIFDERRVSSRSSSRCKGRFCRAHYVTHEAPRPNQNGAFLSSCWGEKSGVDVAHHMLDSGVILESIAGEVLAVATALVATVRHLGH